jgi:thymidine phosphorylase
MSTGGHLLVQAGKAPTIAESCQLVEDSIKNGSAMRSFCDMLKLQGVEPQFANKLCHKDTDVLTMLPKANHITELQCSTSG